MDADIEKRQRDLISKRMQRWSMNSQRLEQIVAELMRPIGDLRRSFDTDLSALLEEYLTEAGLHALEEEGPGPAAPNFAELALLLQQSANIYGRKVDLLYQHVLECSESLHTNTETPSTTEAEASPPTPHGSRRRRRPSSAGAGAGAGAAAGWARIALEPCAAARREPALRPPPTLPRMYVELEPRVLAACDAPLLDYAGEPVGLLQDFNVTWRLHGGLLVDELECGEEATPAALRAIPLSELQAAIEAAAPPSPPPPPPSPEPEPEPPDDMHPPCSTPIPTEPPPPEPLPAPPPPETTTALAKTRKRKQEDPDLFQTGAGKIYLTPELRAFLREQREFSLNSEWVSRVVASRRTKVLALRSRLRRETELKEFHGFDEVDKSDLVDIGGFLGWNSSQVELEATDVSMCLSRLASAAESDDDGFFEQSSLGSEGSRPDRTPSPPTPPPKLPPPVDYAAAPEWMSWRAGVVARAAAGEARGLDVRALGAAVLRALPAPKPAPHPPHPPHDKGPPTPFPNVLNAAAKDDTDVSRLFLATLFLANAGNVEVVQGPALSLNSFSLQLVSRDERRYCAAADADPAFLAR